MSIVDDMLEMQISQEEPLQLQVAKPRQPKGKPVLPTICDSLLELLEEEPTECIAWAEKHYALKASRGTEENAKEAKEILERWQRVKEQRLKWSVLPTSIPTLSSPDPITVKELHTYLSEILAIHPIVATIPVYHEECCGARETGEIEFDEEKGILNFS